MSLFSVLGSAMSGAATGASLGGPWGALGGGILGLLGAGSSEEPTTQAALQGLQTTGLSFLGSERGRGDLDEARAYTTESYNTALQGMRNLPASQTYSPGGGAAYAARQALLGVGGAAPTAAQQAAFQQYKRSAGYQDALRTGRAAITGSRAAAGLLGSGGTARALTRYGHQLGRQAFGDYMNQLHTQVAPGLASDQLFAQGLMNRAGAQSNVSASLAQAMAKYGQEPYLSAASSLGEVRGAGDNRPGGPSFLEGAGQLVNALTKTSQPAKFQDRVPSASSVPVPPLRPDFEARVPVSTLRPTWY